jgi:hypothetical protein
LGECLFDVYHRVISIYIRNKWQTLGIKAGIHDEDIIKNQLKKLVKAIALKNNRLSVILKDKEFNNFELFYQDGQD